MDYPDLSSNKIIHHHEKDLKKSMKRVLSESMVLRLCIVPPWATALSGCHAGIL